MHLLGTHHVAILTTNFEALETFYTRTLGFPVTRRWDDAGIIFIDIGSTKVELIRKDAAGGASGPHALDEGTGINHTRCATLGGGQAASKPSNCKAGRPISRFKYTPTVCARTLRIRRC
jgi:catechol 2,3-dioxygenase-like lactoylglutathione lyase family enzyme